jgi:chaperonin GroEL (HSP60 family)
MRIFALRHWEENRETFFWSVKRKIIGSKSSIVVHAYNPSTLEVG